MLIVKVFVVLAAVLSCSSVEAKRCCCAKHSDPIAVVDQEQPAPPKVKKSCDHVHSEEGEQDHADGCESQQDH